MYTSPLSEAALSANNRTLIDENLKVGQITSIPEDIDARLHIVAGDDVGRVIPLGSPSTVIGREPECALIIDDPRVSGRHALVYFAGGEFRVKDLGSTNGTLLNGSALTDAAYRDGDDLRVGRSVIRIEIDFKEPPELG